MVQKKNWKFSQNNFSFSLEPLAETCTFSFKKKLNYRIIKDKVNNCGKFNSTYFLTTK